MYKNIISYIRYIQRSLLLLASLCVFATFRAQTGGGDLQFAPLSIPVRDGQVLAADLYFSGASPLPKPVILIQTPYNKAYYRTGTLPPGQGGGKGFPKDDRYNYVVLDWRGFYGSKPAAVPGYDRGLDGYDAVEWIAGQPWCAGNVGTWGSSALGYIQYLTARYHPPHLKCCTIQVKDFLNQYSNYYYGGDYRKEHVQSLAVLGFISTALVLAHPTHDSFWQGLESDSDLAAEIQVPVLMVGGWYDHFPSDVLMGFEDLRQKSHPDVRAAHKLIIGPWTHGGVGDSEQGILKYPSATDIYNQEIDFWNYYLLGIENGWMDRPVVQYFQMGEDSWFTSSSWKDISRAEKRLYFQPDNALSENLPAGGGEPARFSYDPADPTPALGGSRFNPFDPDVLVGPQDLGPVEARPDVLVFSTPPLSQDLRVNGPMRAELYVSSDRTDTDFCVRLTDVYPDGRSVIMTQGIRRMRFRNGFETEELLLPGQIYPVTVELQDLALTFKAGHRLRLVVCSADYPHFDKNRNDGGPMYTPGPSHTASNVVYADAEHPSGLVLQVLPSGPLGADFAASPARPTEADPVTFTASASGGTPPYSFSWDLDGDPAVGETASKTFREGAHPIRLTVRDGAGQEASAAKTLDVGPAVTITGAQALSNPFRLSILGSGFQIGCKVEIDGSPSPKTSYKSPSQVVAGGGGLKALVPKGSPVHLVLVNPDGGRSGAYTFVR